MVRWQTVAKFLGGGSVGVIGLFTYLFLLTGISYTYTGDSVCDKLNCEAYINVSTTYWRTCFEHTKDSQKVYLPYNSVYGGSNEKLTPFIYNELESQPVLFKKSTRGRTLWVNLNKVDNIISTDPPISVDWLVPARGKGNWRPIKDGDCWNRLRTNKIKLVGHPTEAQIIKWSFELDEVSIDPIFISWDYTYENLSKQVSVYKEDLIIVKEECFTNITTSLLQCNPDHNYITKTLIGYETVYYQNSGDKILDRMGVKVGDKEYIGWYDVCDNWLVHYLVNPGDRDRGNYCRCRGHELEKNTCEEFNLLK